MDTITKAKIDKRLAYIAKSPDHKYISSDKTTFTVRLAVYDYTSDQPKMTSRYIGSFPSLSEAKEARDYAMEVIGTIPHLSLQIKK